MSAVTAPESARSPDRAEPHGRPREQLILRYGLLVFIVIVFAYFAATEPSFRTIDNLFAILQSVSIVGLIALGMTVSMIVGGFDLSVGANAGFTVMVCAIALVFFGLPVVPVVIIALAVGLLIGLLNGLLIVKLRIPDLLATLGMLFVLQGSQLLPSRGESISTGMTLGNTQYNGVFTDGFLWLGRGDIPAGIPVAGVIFALAALVMWIFLERTRFGRMLYAIGGNAEASRLAGVRVDRWRMIAYMISGLLAAAGGILLAARIGQGDVGAGNPFLLDAVAAALVGYAVLAVNKPNAVGTAIGAVFLGVMLNGLTIKNFPYYTQDFIKGAVLMIALFLSFGLNRRTR